MRINLLNSFHLIQNSPARVVVSLRILSHGFPILKSLHWPKVSERREYKLLILRTKFSQPLNLLTVSLQLDHSETR